MTVSQLVDRIWTQLGETGEAERAGRKLAEAVRRDLREVGWTDAARAAALAARKRGYVLGKSKQPPQEHSALTLNHPSGQSVTVQPTGAWRHSRYDQSELKRGLVTQTGHGEQQLLRHLDRSHGTSEAKDKGGHGS